MRRLTLPAAALLLRLAAGLALAGILSLALIRSAPGYGADERTLDPTLPEGFRATLEPAQGPPGLVEAYVSLTASALRGDFGYSESLAAPVGDLMDQRWQVTAGIVGQGLLAAWLLGAMGAASCLYLRGTVLPLTAASGLLLCLPTGLIAILLYRTGLPADAVVAAALFPKIFSYLKRLWEDAGGRPHVLAAAARGISGWRLFAAHRALAVWPEVVSLLGVSVSMAAGAAIPAEVLCDQPGLGQLAWKAAMARDVAPLIALTWLFTALTFSANSVCTSMAGEHRAWRT